METILAAAFGRQVNVMQGEANDLTRAAASIFKILHHSMTKGRIKRDQFAALLSEDLCHVLNVCANGFCSVLACFSQLNMTHCTNGIH